MALDEAMLALQASLILTGVQHFFQAAFESKMLDLMRSGNHKGHEKSFEMVLSPQVSEA